MTKWLISVLLSILISNYLAAQNLSTTYCEVSIITGGHRLRSLDIDSGYFQNNMPVADSADKAEVDILKQRNSTAEVLNFMSSRGWILYQAFNEGSPSWRKFFYFRKDN